MSLYRKLMHRRQFLTPFSGSAGGTCRVRQWLYSSAAGLMLWAPTSLVQAEPHQPAPPRRILQQEPGRLQLPSFGIREMTPVATVQLVSGEGQPQPRSDVQRQLEELYRRDGREMPDMNVQRYQTPAQNTAVQTAAGGRRAPEPQKSLFDRLFGGLRKDKPGTRPPSDPGMDYPTASQPQPLRTQQPNPSFVPPAVPGAPEQSRTPAPQGTAGGAQPGLFQAPASANPIGHPLTTPAPAEVAPQPYAGSADGGMPKIVPQAPSGNAPHPLAAQPHEQPTQSRSSLPTLDFGAPVPKSTATAETAAVPPAPTGEQVSVRSSKADPFDDIFPEEPEELADDFADQPYTGMTLEEDLFLDADKPRGTAEASPATAAGDRADEPVAKGQEQFLPPVVELPPPMIDEAPPVMVSEKPALSVPEPARQSANPPAADLPKLSDGGPRFGKTAAAAKELPASKAASDPNQSKMELIASRKGQTGLKGFCPVMLRDHRELVDASDEFGAVFDGKNYYFSSETALESFLLEPAKYAPAARGADVIHLALTGEELDGSLDHAVWYKGRLYLFSSVETMETFSAGPSSHATDD